MSLRESLRETRHFRRYLLRIEQSHLARGGAGVPIELRAERGNTQHEVRVRVRQAARHIAAHAVPEDVRAFDGVLLQIVADVLDKMLNPKRTGPQRSGAV